MARYFSAPRASRSRADDDWYFDPLIPDLSVPDHGPVDTGLLDAHGDTIWRAPNPMGFGRNEEWG